MKVSAVASKLATVSAQDMIKAMIAGQRDPEILAGLARGRMKAKHDDLVQALDGMFDDHHGELAQVLLDQIAFLDGRIAQLSARAAELAAAMPEAWGAGLAKRGRGDQHIEGIKCGIEFRVRTRANGDWLSMRPTSRGSTGRSPRATE